MNMIVKIFATNYHISVLFFFTIHYLQINLICYIHSILSKERFTCCSLYWIRKTRINTSDAGTKCQETTFWCILFFPENRAIGWIWWDAYTDEVWCNFSPLVMWMLTNCILFLAKVVHSDLVLYKMTWNGGMHAHMNFDVTEAYESCDIRSIPQNCIGC